MVLIPLGLASSRNGRNIRPAVAGLNSNSCPLVPSDNTRCPWRYRAATSSGRNGIDHLEQM